MNEMFWKKESSDKFNKKGLWIHCYVQDDLINMILTSIPGRIHRIIIIIKLLGITRACTI